MNYSFIKCDFSDIDEFIQKYSESLSSPIDSFLEDHILESKYYLIKYDGNAIGCFSIQKKKTITLFYVDREYRYLSQELFSKVKKMELVQSAILATSDEFFLSCAVDSYRSIENGAYFFQDAKKQASGLNELQLKLATLDDKDSIKNNSDDFFDEDLEDCIKKEEVYIATKDLEVVGYGIISKGKILKDCASIGMYTVEKLRRKGYATKIIQKLKETVYSMNLTPIAGCWYYNHNSKKTLERAGMFTNTRLLKFNF